MLPYRLMPPEKLIVASGIGVTDHAGIATEFHNIGHAMVSDMLRDAFIKPDIHVLDVGCGLGRLARPLVEILSPVGSYHGVDIVEPSVDWCRHSSPGSRNASASANPVASFPPRSGVELV